MQKQCCNCYLLHSIGNSIVNVATDLVFRSDKPLKSNHKITALYFDPIKATPSKHNAPSLTGIERQLLLLQRQLHGWRPMVQEAHMLVVRVVGQLPAVMVALQRDTGGAGHAYTRVTRTQDT